MTTPTDEFDAVIIGAGFSGLYMLHRLRQLGLRCRLYEAGDGVGGTWYWNRYPGARCDSESYFYCYTFSDELLQEWNWTERFPAQDEIMRYLDFVADKFDLRPDIQLETRVVARHLRRRRRRAGGSRPTPATTSKRATWSPRSARSRPPTSPTSPGSTRSQDAGTTPGSWPHEGVDLTGMRVGVIGTGSTGMQLIPVVAEQAAELTVFQRTPNYSMPARNAPLDPEFIAEVKATYAELNARTRQLAWRHAAAGADPERSTRSTRPRPAGGTRRRGRRAA